MLTGVDIVPTSPGKALAGSPARCRRRPDPRGIQLERTVGAAAEIGQDQADRHRERAPLGRSSRTPGHGGRSGPGQPKPSSWTGLLGPGDASSRPWRPIASDTVCAMNEPKTKARITDIGPTCSTTHPEFAAQIRRETDCGQDRQDRRHTADGVSTMWRASPGSNMGASMISLLTRTPNLAPPESPWRSASFQAHAQNYPTEAGTRIDRPGARRRHRSHRAHRDGEARRCARAAVRRREPGRRRGTICRRSGCEIPARWLHAAVFAQRGVRHQTRRCSRSSITPEQGFHPPLAIGDLPADRVGQRCCTGEIGEGTGRVPQEERRQEQLRRLRATFELAARLLTSKTGTDCTFISTRATTRQRRRS